MSQQPPQGYQQPQYPPGHIPAILSQKKRQSLKEMWRSGPTGKCGVLVVAGIILLLVLGICSGLTRTLTSTNSPTSQTATQIVPTAMPTDTPVPTDTPDITLLPAYQLAAQDIETTPDATTISKYQKLLDTLHDKTGEPEQNIADETVRGQQILQGESIPATLYDLMSGVNTAITKSDHLKYTEALASLMTLMQSD